MAQLDLKEAEYSEKKKSLLSTFEEDTVHLNSECKGLEVKINQVDVDIDSLAKSNEELNSQLRDLIEESAQYDRETEASAAKIAQIDQQLKLREAEKANVKVHLDAINNKIAQLEATSEGHKAMNDHLKEEKAKQEAKINELQQNRDKFQKEIEDTKEQLQGQLQKCEDLKSRIENNMTNQVPQKFQDLQDSTSSTKMALVELRNKVASYPDEQKLLSDLQNYEEQIKQDQTKLSEYNNDIEKQKGFLDDCNKDGEVGILKETIAEEVQQLKNVLVTLTKNITDKENQIDLMQNESETLLKTLAELDLQVSKEKDAIESRKEDNRKDQAFKENFHLLTKENEKLNQEISKMEHDLNDYIDNRNLTMDQLQKTNTKAVQEIESELRQLDQDITKQKKKLSDAETKAGRNDKAKFVNPSSKQDTKVSTAAPKETKRARRTLISPESSNTMEIAKRAPPKALSSTALKSLWSSSEED